MSPKKKDERTAVFETMTGFEDGLALIDAIDDIPSRWEAFHRALRAMSDAAMAYERAVDRLPVIRAKYAADHGAEALAKFESSLAASRAKRKGV